MRKLLKLSLLVIGAVFIIQAVNSSDQLDAIFKLLFGWLLWWVATLD